MISLSPDNTLPHLSMQERRDFIKLRRKGYSFEPILQEKVDLQQRALSEKTAEFAEILTQRQQEVERVIDDLTQEVTSVDPFGSAQFQNENLLQTVQKLKQTHANLKEKLDTSQQALHEREMKKTELEYSLNSCCQILHSADGQFYSFQQPLYEGGRRLSLYISHTTKKND